MQVAFILAALFAAYQGFVWTSPKALRFRAIRALARADAIEAQRTMRDKQERYFADHFGLRYEDVAIRWFRDLAYPAPTAQAVQESNAQDS